MTFIKSTRTALSFSKNNFSLIDVINAILDIEKYSIHLSERAEMRQIKFFAYHVNVNFDCNRITDSVEDLCKFFDVECFNKSKLIDLLAEIDHSEGLVNRIASQY